MDGQIKELKIKMLLLLTTVLKLKEELSKQLRILLVEELNSLNIGLKLSKRDRILKRINKVNNLIEISRTERNYTNYHRGLILKKKLYNHLLAIELGDGFKQQEDRRLEDLLV